eukprot:jgi/Bigna1/139148/aug1.48_g13856
MKRFLARIAHCPAASKKKVEINNVEMLIDRKGKIVSIEAMADDGETSCTSSCYTSNTKTTIDLRGPGKFLIPGFIDVHIHAPQYSYTGQRGFVGPISMDINPGVPQYGQRTDAALKDAETFVEYLINPEFSSQSRLSKLDEGNEEGLVLPVITPRHRCHIQSHVSESLDVMEEVVIMNIFF